MKRSYTFVTAREFMHCDIDGVSISLPVFVGVLKHPTEPTPFTLGSARHAPEVPGGELGCATGGGVDLAGGGGSRRGSRGLGSELHATSAHATRMRISRTTRARRGVFHDRPDGS
jgi:hypothetical protein